MQGKASALGCSVLNSIIVFEYMENLETLEHIWENTRQWKNVDK